jgi:hypothetical protein
LVCSQQTKVQKTKHTQRVECRKQPLSEFTDSSPGRWQSLIPIIGLTILYHFFIDLVTRQLKATP